MTNAASMVTGAQVGGAVVGGAAVTAAQVGVSLEDVSEGTVTLTFPAATVFTQDIFHLRRAFVGSNMSRAWVSVMRDGVRYVYDALHGGSGANAATWESALSGASRRQVTLTAGNRTAAQVAQHFADAMALDGITEVTLDGAGGMEIDNVSGLLIGATPTYDTSLRGIWGAQRDVFGGSSTPSSSGNMGGTGSVHLTAPSTAGRILGIGMRAGGSNNVRLGIADGPAYSTTPAAFSNGQEGVSTNASGIRVLLFSEPIAYTSSQNKWLSFRGAGGGDPTLTYRNHADTPAGRGDIPVNEQLLFSTTTSDPTTAIYTAGAYTHGAEAGPYTIYSHVFLIYECPTDGSYPGNGAIVTRLGSHNTATAGTPTATVAADMDAETFGFRQVVPWDCNLIDVRVSIAANAADEDLGLAIYRALDTVAPTASSNPLLRGVGPMGLTTATGYQTHTLSTPLAITAGWTVWTHFAAGNVDGVTPTDTISVNYDPNPLGDDYWQTSWDDNGRVWNDMVPAGGGGLGVVAEYRTIAPGSDMPLGDPSPSWPDPFDGDATDDHSTENLLRYSIGVTRTGITGSEL